MRLISFGKTNKKFWVYVLAYIAVTIALNTISIILQNSDQNIKNNLKNIPLMIIIIHASLILLIFLECWLRNAFPHNSEDENEDSDNNNKIIYIFNNPRKVNYNLNQLLILILIIVLDYIYDAGIMYYQKKNKQKSELVFGEIYKFIDVFFLFLFFRIFHKIYFYKNQIVALIIIIIVGFGKFFNKIFYDEDLKEIIQNNFDFRIISLIIFFPLIDSIKMFVLQKYMIYHYYSPMIICILIGFIYLFISIILIVIFYNISCESEACNYFGNEGMEVPNIGQIFLLIFYSIFYSLEHFMNLLTINNFTVFHSILVVTFGELINSFYNLFPNFELFDLIMNIVAYFFEIIGVLVFIEAIELNFCGLNRNLTKNIMFRAGNEVESIYNSQRETDNESDDLDYNINEELNITDDTIYN